MLTTLLLLLAAAPADSIRFDAGAFTRGSERSPDEQPKRTIQLSGFRIDRTEVSIERFEQFVREGWKDRANWSPDGWAWQGTHSSGSGATTRAAGRDARHPVVAVSWYEADAYCRWQGGHLPTEAQWERAACNGSSQPYPWGTDTDKPIRWSTIIADADVMTVNTAPVEEDVQRHPLGLRHMIGNVWEWTGDWYHREAYAAAAESDPTGPKTGTWRVLRGGSFSNLPSYATCTHREPARPEQPRLTAGFRCAYSD